MSMLEKLRVKRHVRNLGRKHTPQFQYPTMSKQSQHTNNYHGFHVNTRLDIVPNETNKVSPSSHLFARETWFLHHIGTAHALGRKNKTLSHVQCVSAPRCRSSVSCQRLCALVWTCRHQMHGRGKKEASITYHICMHIFTFVCLCVSKFAVVYLHICSHIRARDKTH